VVDRYPEGNTVRVFYDPADPTAAVLEPGAGLGAYIPLGAGIFMVVAGIVTGAAGLLRKKPNPNISRVS
jgi:hypothetical protein